MVQLQVFGIGKCHNEFITIRVPSVHGANNVRGRPKAAKLAVKQALASYYQQCGLYSEQMRWVIDATVKRANGLSAVRSQGTLNSIIVSMINGINAELPTHKRSTRSDRVQASQNWKRHRTISWALILVAVAVIASVTTWLLQS